MAHVPLLLMAALNVSGMAHGVPAFARQTGMACSACHTQHFPSLNAMGRSFKANGFTLTTTPLMQGTRLSIPASLNASLFIKLRVQRTNGTDLDSTSTTNSGEMQFPDEFVLFLGGRVSEHVGFVLEGQLPVGGAGVLASFKMPFTYPIAGMQTSVIPFTTDGLGASYGFELLNTGAVRNIRFMEHRNDFSAQQYVGTSSPASGAAFVVANSRFFANYSRWSPTHLASTDGLASPLPTTNYARVAVTPMLGEWDIGFGAQAWFGTARVDDGSGNSTLMRTDTKAWALDGQAQGQVGTWPLGLFLSYARSAATDAAGNPNLFNGGPRARTALALAGELGVLPERASVMLAYRLGDNGSAGSHQDRALTVGGLYQLNQNVQFQLNYTFRSGDVFDPKPAGGNQLMSLILAAGF